MYIGKLMAWPDNSKTVPASLHLNIAKKWRWRWSFSSIQELVDYFHVSEMLLAKFEPTLFNFSYLLPLCTKKENGNIFMVAFSASFVKVYFLFVFTLYFFSKISLDFIEQEKYVICHVKRRILCVNRKNSFDNCFTSFRVRMPKNFYLSTSETSTTLSTHTVCYVSSTANTQCGRKKRRCVFGIIAPLWPFTVPCFLSNCSFL